MARILPSRSITTCGTGVAPVYTPPRRRYHKRVLLGHLSRLLITGRTASRSTSVFAACLLVCASLVSGGCLAPQHRDSINPTQVRAGSDSRPPRPDDDAGADSVFNRPLRRLVVDFKVHRISGSPGSFGTDSPLWKIMTVGLPDAEASLRLSANGFRVAVGRESDRPALKAFIEDIGDLHTAVDRVTPDASKSVYLELGPCDSRQSVFFYDRQGDLHGLGFVDATARFKLAFEMRSSNLKEVWLRLLPELREPPGPPQWKKGADGEFHQTPEQRGRSFVELSLAAKIPEGGFLLLAPTPAVHERPLLARPFFINARPARPGNGAVGRESIYIISPIVRSLTQGASGRPAESSARPSD